MARSEFKLVACFDRFQISLTNERTSERNFINVAQRLQQIYIDGNLGRRWTLVLSLSLCLAVTGSRARHSTRICLTMQIPGNWQPSRIQSECLPLCLPLSVSLAANMIKHGASLFLRCLEAPFRDGADACSRIRRQWHCGLPRCLLPFSLALCHSITRATARTLYIPPPTFLAPPKSLFPLRRQFINCFVFVPPRDSPPSISLYPDYLLPLPCSEALPCQARCWHFLKRLWRMDSLQD